MRPALIIVALLVTSIVTLIWARPDSFRFQRSIEVAAPPALIERQVSDLHLWVNWSPFDRADPQMQRTYGGPPAGPGSSLAWSGNDRVGQGRVHLTRATPGETVMLVMLLDRPVRAAALSTFSLSSPRPGITKVTWSIEGKASLTNRLLMGVGFFERHFDRKLQAGLMTLKAVAEAEATARDRVSLTAP